MAVSDLVVTSVLADAVKGAFSGMKALLGSPAAVVASTLPGDKRGGNSVDVPYFGLSGELEDVAEGVSLTSKSIKMSEETASVVRSGARYNVTQWEQLAAQYADPYGKAATDLVEMVQRRADKALIDAAAASLPSSMVVTKTTKIDWDAVVDAKACFSDEADDLALMAIHSKVKTDLYKLKDSTGRPLFVDQSTGALGSFCGVPLVVSDRCPVTVTMGAVSSTGTSPPTITLTGTPNRAIDLRIECTTLGARGTSKIRYSVDGGINWQSNVTTAATINALDAGGTDTGLVLNIATGNAAVDNVWTASATYQFKTLLVQRGALAFWYNGNPSVSTEYTGATDSHDLNINVYHVAHRYSRMPGKTRPGVAHLVHV